ncbi:class I SAM-dependent methyltransferase [Subtercola sp. YIM 133946]|uniref:class I SAM-dependent methyltransferase n=1 Tax=Subtercola sp. YIM 133946 TaxID=3118909 RepID=UPI002F948ADB
MTDERAKDGDFGAFGMPQIRQVAALGRSILNRPHTREGDAEAQIALVQGMQPFGGPIDPEMLEKMRPLTGFRSDFFDNEVLKALASGITQVVNCGAGYDDRALRFRDSAVTYFELDLPEVIVDKNSRLERMGADVTQLRPIGLDLEVDDVAVALTSAGHDLTAPTFFMCEQLNATLSPWANARLLASLFSRARPGSRLALTIEASNEGLDPTQVRERRNAFFGGSAPMKTIVPRAEWLGLVGDAGWRVESPESVLEVMHTHEIHTQAVTATA